MTFRTRLFLAFGLATALPVLALGLGVRRTLAARAQADASSAAAEAEEALAVALGSERIRVATALGALSRRLADDDRMRLAALGRPDAKAWLGAEAAEWTRTGDLDLLLVQGPDGATLAASGPAADSGLAAAVAAATPPALIEAGGRLAVAAAEPLGVAGTTHLLLGGRAVDPEAPAGQLPEGLRAQVVPPGSALQPPEGWRVVAEVPVAYFGAARGPGGSAGGKIVVSQDPAPYAALRRSFDLRLALALAVALPVALGIAAMLARSLARPLAALAERAETMDLGREGAGFGTDSDDEVGTLAAALDRMNVRLTTSAARLQAAERAAATGELARQVNHDLKNGLVPIRHVLRHLKSVAQEQPERLPQVFLEREPSLEDSLAYLETLARSYGARRTPTGRADLNAVARAVAAEHDGRPVRLELAEPAPFARADEVSLRRILGNLVANALDALEGAPREREGVTISTAPRGETVLCAVEDRGRGMGHDELARAFDAPFTTKPGGSGTGLGVVRRLVEELGGSIRVETAPGRGTRVELALPVAGDAGGSV
ncbi:MAG TPA: HAMP domain-containing sensor histidine kinase [Gemmatimonadales bacterium]|nr:HAMP domain-containing sensor histidine kinase [Gemmatimonadales bacterium]